MRNIDIADLCVKLDLYFPLGESLFWMDVDECLEASGPLFSYGDSLTFSSRFFCGVTGMLVNNFNLLFTENSKTITQ